MQRYRGQQQQYVYWKVPVKFIIFFPKRILQYQDCSDDSTEYHFQLNYQYQENLSGGSNWISQIINVSLTQLVSYSIPSRYHICNIQRIQPKIRRQYFRIRWRRPKSRPKSTSSGEPGAYPYFCISRNLPHKPSTCHIKFLQRIQQNDPGLIYQD